MPLSSPSTSRSSGSAGCTIGLLYTRGVVHDVCGMGAPMDSEPGSLTMWPEFVAVRGVVGDDSLAGGGEEDTE
jgi:hypothetical protein